MTSFKPFDINSCGEDDWAAFAKAEAEVEDPVQARHVEKADDPYGVNAVFA